MAEHIRAGKVSSVDPVKGTVKVTYDDKDGMVSTELPLMSDQQRMPKVGENVVTLSLPNGQTKGVCLGGYFDDSVSPPTQKEDEIVVDFEGAQIIGKRGSGELKIIGKDLKIEIEGEVTITCPKVNVIGELYENDRRVVVM